MTAAHFQLIEFLKSNGFTAQELARTIGTCPPTMCLWMKNRRSPTAYYRRLLWILTGIEPHEWGTPLELKSLHSATPGMRAMISQMLPGDQRRADERISRIPKADS